jgi:hypothetical protein
VGISSIRNGVECKLAAPLMRPRPRRLGGMPSPDRLRQMVEARADLDRLARSAARLSQRSMILSLIEDGAAPDVACRRIGAPLLLERLWQESGCHTVEGQLAGRRFEFAVERSVPDRAASPHGVGLRPCLRALARRLSHRRHRVGDSSGGKSRHGRLRQRERPSRPSEGRGGTWWWWYSTWSRTGLRIFSRCGDFCHQRLWYPPSRRPLPPGRGWLGWPSLFSLGRYRGWAFLQSLRQDPPLDRDRRTTLSVAPVPHPWVGGCQSLSHIPAGALD